MCAVCCVTYSIDPAPPGPVLLLLLQAKAIVSSPLMPLLFAAAYAVLAWQAWQGGSLGLVQTVLHAAKPWPDASLLAAMFQDRTLAALAWLHLLMLDFLTARWEGCEGARCVWTVHPLREVCGSRKGCLRGPAVESRRRTKSQNTLPLFQLCCAICCCFCPPCACMRVFVLGSGLCCLMVCGCWCPQRTLCCCASWLGPWAC